MMTPEQKIADLVNRLRGIYTVPVNDGAGPLNGADTFTRVFTGLPPIHGEAADALESQARELVDLRDAARRHEELEAAHCPEDQSWVETLLACRRELAEVKSLAKIGEWHDDCRLNRQQAADAIQKLQATIDKMADAIAAANQRTDEARAIAQREKAYGDVAYKMGWVSPAEQRSRERDAATIAGWPKETE